MLARYNSFTEDIILERMINESFLYLSPNVRKVLGRLFARNHNDIAGEILSSEGTDVKPDVTFIDLGKEGYLSFITMKNAKPLLVAKYGHMDWARNIDNKAMPDPKLYTNDLYEYDIKKDPDSTGIFTKSRNEVGLGKFVNKLFPGKYNSKQVEEFVNSFKAAVEKSGESFDIVEGEDIEKWYWYENYKEMSGTLGNSCMAKKRNIFEIYTQNQDVCKMLVLFEDDKIIGRALVWKLKSIKKRREDVEGIEYFMDRQYTIKESDVQKFKDYAEKEGWAYKAYNNHHSYTTIRFKGEEFNVDMEVQLANKRYQRFPYMDTFRRYNPETGILYNDDESESDYEGCYILDDTSGGYTEVEGGVYSEWHDRRIPEDEAVYSEYLGDYLLRDYAVEVTRGSRRNMGWYPEDHDNIVRAYDNNTYYIDDTVYSEIYGEHVFVDDAVLVVTDIYKDGDVPRSDDQYMQDDDDNIVFEREYSSMTWFKFLSENFRDWEDYSGVSKDVLTKDSNGKWIPKIFAEDVFKVSNAKDESSDIIGSEYLLEIDAEILGYEIDKSDKKVIDMFQYSEDISHLLEDIKKRVRPLIRHYNDILNQKGQLRLKFDDEEERQYLNKIERLLRKSKERLEDIDDEKYYKED